MKHLYAATAYTVAWMLAYACGGRIANPDCGQLAYCRDTDVCCQSGWTCGDGHNGCPFRGCCEPSPFPKDAEDDDSSGEWDVEAVYPPTGATPTSTGRPVGVKQ